VTTSFIWASPFAIGVGVKLGTCRDILQGGRVDLR